MKANQAMLKNGIKTCYKFIKICSNCKKEYGTDYRKKENCLCMDCSRVEKKLKKLQKLSKSPVNTLCKKVNHNFNTQCKEVHKNGKEKI